jgi:DNA invertase Pin-like site-specific DNA recombinase
VTAKRRPYNVTRCLLPVSTSDTCSRTRPVARATIVPGLPALDFVRPGDCLVVWKLDRLGRSLPHLLSIVTSLRDRNVAFRSLTEQMDTTTPHGEFLFGVFGALAQFERALTQERVRAGLAAARRRGRRGGRPPAIGADKLEAVITALDAGTSKAAVCRSFGVARSTLIDTLARAGWTGPGSVS